MLVYGYNFNGIVSNHSFSPLVYFQVIFKIFSWENIWARAWFVILILPPLLFACYLWCNMFYCNKRPFFRCEAKKSYPVGMGWHRFWWDGLIGSFSFVLVLILSGSKLTYMDHAHRNRVNRLLLWGSPCLLGPLLETFLAPTYTTG